MKNGAPKSTTGGGAEHRIASIEVKNFKSLQKISVELAQVSVFIGANGAGKSSLLEAVGILGAAAEGTIDDQALARRGVRPGVPALYKSAFAGERLPAKISLRARSASGVDYHAYLHNPIEKPLPRWIFGGERLMLGEETIASRGGRAAKVGEMPAQLVNDRSVTTLVRAGEQTPAAVRAFLSVLDDFAIFTPVTPVLRGTASDPAPRQPVGLQGGQLPEAIADIQRTPAGATFKEEALSLIEWADDFAMQEPSRAFLSPSVSTMRHILRFEDRFMTKGRNRLSAYDASEGALYVLFLLVLAMHESSPRSFAVDNFDQALNPRAARALTKAFVDRLLETGRQALLTTHNPLVLDGLALWDERVRLYVVERDPAGKTGVRPVRVRDVERLKRETNDLPLSRLWVTGQLGGLPHV